VTVRGTARKFTERDGRGGDNGTTSVLGVIGQGGTGADLCGLRT